MALDAITGEHWQILVGDVREGLASLDYAQLGVKRLKTPWVPVGERKKSSKVKRKHRLQRELF